jgi:molybdopterin biosynthesis enzyme
MSSYFYLKKLPPAAVPKRKIVQVPINDGLGCELAENVVSETDIPPYSQALRDGWAARSSETGPWVIDGSVENGTIPEQLRPGYCMHINTGGFLPLGADCVIPEKEARRDGIVVSASRRWSYFEENVLPQGCEWRKGELLLKTHSLLSAAEIALLSDAGVESVNIYKKPRISILATGSEITDVPGSFREKGVRHGSNGIYLTNLLKTLELSADNFRVISDNSVLIAEELLSLSAVSDYIITIGGTGKGQKDLIRDALRISGAREFVSDTALTDSLPFVEASLGETQILGLPGNPLGFVSLTQRVLLPRLWLFFRSAPLPFPNTHAELGFDIDAKAGEVCVELIRGTSGWIALPVMKGTGRTSVFQKVSGVIPNPHGLALAAGTRVLVELFISSLPASYAFA